MSLKVPQFPWINNPDLQAWGIEFEKWGRSLDNRFQIIEGTKGAKGDKGDPGESGGPFETEDITLTASTYVIDTGQINKVLYIFCGYNGTCDVSFPTSSDGDWMYLVFYGQTGAAYKFSISSWGTNGSTTAIASTAPAKAYYAIANAMGGWYYTSFSVGAAGTRA